MISIRIAPAARADIAAALRHSRATFGPAARARYARLVSLALSHLVDDPARVGVRMIDDDLRSYHLKSTARYLARAERVSKPRHLIVFRRDGDTLLVVRVLDDRMDLPAQLG